MPTSRPTLRRLTVVAGAIALATTGAAPVHAASPVTASAVTAMAAALTAVPAAASPKASKVPSLVSQRVQQVNRAAGVGGSLDAQEQQALSGPELRVDRQARLDLEIHALRALTGRERAELTRLGASVLVGSDEWVKPARVAKLPDVGILRALVPHDQVERVSALPWVAAIRPTEILPPDAGSFLSEGVALHRADDAQAIGVDGAGVAVGADDLRWRDEPRHRTGARRPPGRPQRAGCRWWR